MINQNKYLSTFQWFVFLLANSIALPIVIGDVFQLTPTAVSDLTQRMFFIVGLSSLLQAKFGHRFPLADGPAGSWVSIFVIYAAMGHQQGMALHDTLQTLSGGILIAGILLFILGITKWVQQLLFLFTPIVTGTFLLILAIQLSVVFINGMMSKSSETGQINLVSFILSLFVFIFILLLTQKGKGWIRSYSILLGIIVGWLLFISTGNVSSSVNIQSAVMKLPQPFAWGVPEFNGSIVITAVLFTFLLISNTVAALTAGGEIIPTEKNQMPDKLYSGTWIGGVSHLLSAMFSTIAVVPIPATAGFVKLTRQSNMLPFLYACVIIMIVALFPGVIGILVLLPLPIASAALLSTLIDMFRIAFHSLTKQPLNKRNKTIIIISLFVGIGTMLLPDPIFDIFPNTLQFIVKNGLLMGTLVAILLEQVWKVKQDSHSANNY